MVANSYDIVYRTLKKKIASGEYPEKALLPSEPQLCSMFSVSRTTVRKAVEMLQYEGYVKPQRGIGTVVLRSRAVQDLNKLTSMTETLMDRGYEVSLKFCLITVENADETVAKYLDIKVGSKVAHVFRIIKADDTPIAIINNFIPYVYVNGIENYADKLGSLYRLLKTEFYLDIEMTRDHIVAINATRQQALDLEVEKGFALINVYRVCLNRDKAVSFDIVSARSDMYEYRTSFFNK